MVPLRWIKMSLSLILMLQFTVFSPAAAEQHSSSFTVRVGDEVTLSCGNVIHDQSNCESTTWMLSKNNKAVTLFEQGQIHRGAATKSDRLSVTANCSLVIKKVTDEDVGLYSCRQFVSEQKQGPDFHVDLFVITSEESTEKPSIPKLSTGQTKETSVDRQTPANNNNPSQQAGSSWLFIIVSVSSAALLITAVVIIIIWKKTKGNKKEKENTELSLNPPVTQSGPEASQETADPEDGVSYASISFTSKTRQREQVSDTVTYSTVKASSSSTGVSIDPNSLYSTVNKPQK
ncbi:uncharacterized protein LOC121633265 isoform X1 [Melanotaenia boesemani]|uniref:uncharacterized protein LOC121633265 isoform X1 n=1 Tax=Melanotaenia boesemani TaxID=1250792 RepID=UPI001C03E582|nr:uncharacterized protein LOC121633265 isoform X1 [Melanotaenia boesemani]